MTNERKAVQFHDRLVAALDFLRKANCDGSARVDDEGRCTNCARFSCGEARALLAEIDANDEGRPK